MNNGHRKQKLRRLIERKLGKRITADYVYLDLPYHQNIGDLLIWEGTEQFLGKLPYKCLYKASFDTYVWQELAPDTIIIMHGGGNFGDLWRAHQDFRLKIIQNYPNNRIVILPQTVFYEDLTVLEQDATVMASHKWLTICARDKKSYDLLKKHRMATDIMLLPDMAFCMSDESVASLEKEEETIRTLVVRRKDKEQDRNFDYAELEGMAGLEVDEHDWPPYENPDDEILNRFWLYKNQNDHRLLNDFAESIYRPHMLNTGSRFVSRYKNIYTTRLHVAILCILMNKQVHIIDNSYGKNSSFYATWLTGMKGVELIGYKNSRWQGIKDYFRLKINENN